MAFQIKRQHADKKLGRVVIVLHDPEVDHEHHVIVYVGHESCPTCGHVKPKTEQGQIDLKKLIAEEKQNLETSHNNTARFAARHGIPLLGRPN